MCLKAKIDKIIREITLERQGVIKSRKKAGEHVLASSVFCGHHSKCEEFHQPSWSLATTNDFPEAERPPCNYQTDFQAGWGGGVRSKRKTHHLLDKMVGQRLKKGPRLLKHLIHNVWRNIASIDEVWCYMSHVNGKRKILHEFRGKKSSEENLCTEASTWNSFRRGNQCLWSHCHPFHLLPPPPPTKQKSTSSSEWTKFSSPFSKKDIPRLFGKDANSVELHHDSARAQAAAAIVQWLENSCYNFIPRRNWPTNSPDWSLMDYSVNGIFKRRFW